MILSAFDWRKMKLFAGITAHKDKKSHAILYLFFLLWNVAALIDRDVCAEENIKKFSFKKGSKKLQQWINAIKVGSRMFRTKGRKKSKDDDKKIALKMIVPSLFLFVTTSYQANFFFMCRELCISEKRLKHYLCLFNKQHRSEIIKGEGSNTHLLLFFILSLSLQLVFNKAIQCTLSIITTMHIQQPFKKYEKKFLSSHIECVKMDFCTTLKSVVSFRFY